MTTITIVYLILNMLIALILFAKSVNYFREPVGKPGLEPPAIVGFTWAVVNILIGLAIMPIAMSVFVPSSIILALAFICWIIFS
jgi:hypothetical protein